MATFLRVAAGLALGLTVLAGLLYLRVAANITRRLEDPRGYKSAFNDAGAYDRIYDEGLTEPASKEQTGRLLGDVEIVAHSTGSNHTCGMRTDGSVACWGSNLHLTGDETGQATPPEGELASVSAGESHTCGVRTDGPVECWGDDYDGQSTPPEGEFASVSAGGAHTCGLRNDGAVVCWGSNTDGFDRDYGQARPPEGEFASVSFGGSHTCGMRSGVTVACWGNDDLGEATPPVADTPAG